MRRTKRTDILAEILCDLDRYIDEQREKHLFELMLPDNTFEVAEFEERDDPASLC